jgi:hypothetical protein
MTAERFRALIDAYGADPRRWPQAERAPAQEWAERDGADPDHALADAAMLDRLLASHVVTAPHSRLLSRIVASAPTRRASRHKATWWWSGFGFAGIGLAGVAAGALAVSIFATILDRSAPSDWPYVTTAFSAPTHSGSDE